MRPGGSSLMTSSAIMMAGRVMGSAAGFGIQILLARLLTPDDLGLFYLVTSGAIVLGTLAALGYPAIANQFVVRYTVRGNDLALTGFIKSARRDALMAAAILTVCAVVVVMAVALAGTSRPEFYLPAAAGVLAIPAFSILRVNGGIANALEQFSISFLPDNLFRPVLFGLSLLFVVLIWDTVSLLQVLSLFAALAITVAVVQTIVVGRLEPPHRRDVRPGRRQIRWWRRSGRRLIAPLLISALFADLVILFAGLILPASGVAVLGLCLKIAFLFGFLIQLVHQIILPRLAGSLTRRDQSKVALIVGRTNKLTIVASVAALIFVAFGGETLLGFFGPAFRDGASTLVILILAQLVRALGGPAMSLLIASGRHSGATTVMVLSLSVFAAVCFATVPALGVLGAAIAVLLATATSSAGLAYIVHRELGYRCDGFSSMGLPAANSVSSLPG